MPNILEIPKRQRSVLVKLLRLSGNERTRLLETIQQTKPSLFGREFSKAWSKASDVSDAEAGDMFHVLASLYVSMDITGDPIEKFSAQVCESIKASEDLSKSLKGIDWSEAQRFLGQLLSLDSTLGVSAKASEIKSEYTHVFRAARILTDLRPVYGRDIDKGPSWAVVMHEAKITFHENQEDQTKDFYVALDNEDIVELKRLLDRAIRKEVGLKASAERGGINVLEV